MLYVWYIKSPIFSKLSRTHVRKSTMLVGIVGVNNFKRAFEII